MTDNEALIAEARHQLMEHEVLYGPVRAGHWAYIAHRLADALESASAERAVVEAQALEQAAEKIAEWRMNVGSSGNRAHDESWDNGNMSAESMLRARAVEIREGRQ